MKTAIWEALLIALAIVLGDSILPGFQAWATRHAVLSNAPGVEQNMFLRQISFILGAWWLFRSIFARTSFSFFVVLRCYGNGFGSRACRLDGIKKFE
jgi:hypothetical protein